MDIKDLRVRDIMTTDILFVSPDTKIEQAADILMDKKIHGLLVIDNENLVGIVTKTDFFSKGSFNIHLPSYIDFIENFKISGKLPKNRQEQIKGLLDADVKDIMTKDCITILPDTTVLDMIKLLKTTYLHTLPVVNLNGKAIGVATVSDILTIL